MSAPSTTPVGRLTRDRPAAAERTYRLLLRAYPPEFRSEYGREMTLLFRDQYQASGANTLGFWTTVMWDVARSAPALRVEEWRSRGRESTRTPEVTMKTAAMLTVLLGVFLALSAVAEGRAGLQVQGTLEGTHLLAVVLGAVAGALLLTAGVALLRRTPSGRRTATLASFASLVIVLIARLMHPWMSIASQIVGVGLPIVLLAVLYLPRRSGPSAPRAA